VFLSRSSTCRRPPSFGNDVRRPARSFAAATAHDPVAGEQANTSTRLIARVPVLASRRPERHAPVSKTGCPGPRARGFEFLPPCRLISAVLMGLLRDRPVQDCCGGCQPGSARANPGHGLWHSVPPAVPPRLSLDEALRGRASRLVGGSMAAAPAIARPILGGLTSGAKAARGVESVPRALHPSADQRSSAT